MKDLLTIGQIAKQLEVPIHKIEYIVTSRKIQPQFRAGIIRMFGPSGINQISGDLAKIKARAGLPK